ncbi:MAG: adenylyl-sulfate kinase [Deltaproteobacteria bacterium]|nr:adenylyl-sulfate kinase [Deltaproteobacteria bacterium]
MAISSNKQPDRAAQHVVPHAHRVLPAQRRTLKGHNPAVLWFTGLSGSGKSTVANEVETLLNHRGVHTYLLDGDNLRTGLNRDLGFSSPDRRENIRRVGEVARLFADSGLVVLAALISPFREDRQAVRQRLEGVAYAEIYIKCPQEECEKRDPKGLHQKARAGDIPQFTGISSPYEPPETPELTLDTQTDTPQALAQAVINWLEQNSVIPHPRRGT